MCEYKEESGICTSQQIVQIKQGTETDTANTQTQTSHEFICVHAETRVYECGVRLTEVIMENF